MIPFKKNKKKSAQPAWAFVGADKASDMERHQTTGCHMDTKTHTIKDTTLLTTESGGFLSQKQVENCTDRWW